MTLPGLAWRYLWARPLAAALNLTLLALGIASLSFLLLVRDQVERALQRDLAAVQALNNRTVKLEGSMMPLEAGEKQRHFLLSSVPTTCPFCVPAGPEGLVEVRSRTPVKYTPEPVTVEGKMAVLTRDPYGLFYRIVDAQPSQP
jgi:hypothetical protein